jgi:formamidopyrimidine-DNA glycosylase
MPELPEVEILVRHLRPLIQDKRIRNVQVRRAKTLSPTSAAELKRVLLGAKLTGLSRRGKYLLFELRPRGRRLAVVVAAHLGMTGRIYLVRHGSMLPKHAAVVLNLGGKDLIFEDTRYFGRFTLDTSILAKLGPEPLGDKFTASHLDEALARSTQSIKVKLLDQSLLAGVGNIYASEALFRARISPRLAAHNLTEDQVRRLWRAIRTVLAEAIRFGSTVPLNHGQDQSGDGLFYFGRAADAPNYYEERLRVYDRAGRPCGRCGSAIKRIVQAARSTFYCPACQRQRRPR